ncbi:MAG TPA: D-tyrosyl-tRNA(Tyr) deacylase [Firmicutes bacterium]|jgi:D-tyrosyl-tRNA(Tyr) deacylase|nr:D-tyrosyl-tRNA(Tyr) deacylase [Bacillota bacterium]
MRVLIQRVTEARVVAEGKETGKTGQGFLILVGAGKGDTQADARRLAEKTVNLRVFEDAAGKMNLSLLDVGGGALVVSQFTLYADCRKGRRPSFTEAAPPEEGERLYLEYAKAIEEYGVRVATGVFGAHMQVELVNDGPVTIWLDSQELAGSR